MQKKKSMAKTLKFVCGVILFLFLFLVAAEINGKPFFSIFHILHIYLLQKKIFF